jgi:hypothetical protein
MVVSQGYGDLGRSERHSQDQLLARISPLVRGLHMSSIRLQYLLPPLTILSTFLGSTKAEATSHQVKLSPGERGTGRRKAIRVVRIASLKHSIAVTLFLVIFPNGT